MMPTESPSRTDPLHWLDTVLREDPLRSFLRTGAGLHWSYAEFDSLAHHIAAVLASLGVIPGDRVAAQIAKSPQGVALYVACLKIGAVFVPLNTAYTQVELGYFLSDAEPRVIVADPAALPEVSERSGAAHVLTLDEGGNGSLMQLAGQCSESSGFDRFSGHHTSLAALLYTSGTTGRSKGAMLTRGNLASNAATLAAAWRFTANDVLLHALPIFHVHGLFVAVNTVLASGSSMLFLPRFSADEIVRNLPQATVMMGVPTFYTRLLQHPQLNRDSTRAMRLFISGSAPLLPETHRQFQERTGHAILERYGMSETLMNTSNPYEGARIPGSVGPPLPAIDVRIADPDSGAIQIQPDAIGMIEVRGPNVFSGYWRMPGKTAQELRSDGFFITGDLGRIDAHGYVHIVGRGKDLVITGGYNVYPIEVETEIDALPGIVESAVIGLPHADFGEAVTAVVVRSDVSVAEASVRRALEPRLANFKLPKRVLFVDELPRNTMGKVQKSALRERFRDLYTNADAGIPRMGE